MTEAELNKIIERYHVLVDIGWHRPLTAEETEEYQTLTQQIDEEEEKWNREHAVPSLEKEGL